MQATTARRPGRSLPRSLGAANICEAFAITVANGPERPALRTLDGSLSLTWGEYAERVRDLAAGFAALGLGRGQAIALLLTNRPEAHLVDMAALHCGAVPVSLYPTLAPEQMEYVLGHAGAQLLVTEARFLPAVRALNGDFDVVLADGSDPRAIPLERIADFGSPALTLEACRSAIEPSDVANLIYTSGTTGPPKGAQLTHANIFAGMRGVVCSQRMEPWGRVLSYNPMAHVSERVVTHYRAIASGDEIVSVADPTELPAALASVHPTGFFGVPTVWERLKAGLESRGVHDPDALPEDARADALAAVGLDRAMWTVTAAAATPHEVIEYFLALGLPLCEAWGMTELSVGGTINPPDRIKVGTCGRTYPEHELRVADDGELLVRGPSVFAGYRDDPEGTREAIDPQGWLRSGDLATIDDDGYVTIVGRKKEMMISAHGKNMSPSNIEARVRGASPLVAHCMAVGNARRYNAALIALDPQVTEAYARENGIGGGLSRIARHERVHAEIAAAIERANSHLSEPEQIRVFALVETAWRPGSDELTPTMKLRREEIGRKYSVLIESMYA